MAKKQQPENLENDQDPYEVLKISTTVNEQQGKEKWHSELSGVWQVRGQEVVISHVTLQAEEAELLRTVKGSPACSEN